MRNEIKSVLFELQKRKCAVCGKELPDLLHAQVDHIIPVKQGGSNDTENLRLLCSHCNSKTIFRGYEFENYIFDIFVRSEKFNNIQREFIISSKYSVDLIVQEKPEIDSAETIVEIQYNSSLTIGRIINIIERFEKIKELVENQKYNYALLFPGDLSEKGMELLNRHNIQIWDKAYLYNKFSKQINELEHPLFKALLTPIPVKKTEEEFIDRLKKCTSGKPEWAVYQKLIGEILEHLFCPPLRSPLQENRDFFSVNRRDFILPNYSETGFWSYLSARYFADYIVVDAKNYNKGITKKEVLQMANYLKPHGTRQFGIIISRSGISENTIYTLREIWALEKKLILVLDDTNVEQMLLEKMNQREPEAVLRQKIEDFRLSI